MKLIVRFLPLASAALAFGFTMFGSAQPVLAGCGNELVLTGVTAYRDHIVISFNQNNVNASPIQFDVRDSGTLVGSTTFSSGATGSFTVEFDLDSSVVQELDTLNIQATPDLGCNQFAVATATGFFHGGKATPQCADGRINYNNCDKIAIYPVKDEGSFGIEVLIVDKKVVPEFAIFISAADLNALPSKPNKVITVATSKNGLVVLYKHPNGDYQVNYGPDFEGKVFTFRFNGLPASSYPEVTTFMAGVLLPRLTPEIG